MEYYGRMKDTEEGMQGGHMFRCPEDCTKCKLYVSMILGAW